MDGDEKMEVIQAYTYALDPTPARQTALASHCGAARFAYNHLLRMVSDNLSQRATERAAGTPDDDLTSPLSWSAYSLRRLLNSLKDDIAPWWGENSKEAFATGAANLAAALKNWSDSRRGARKGRPVGFPRPKRKGRARESCVFTTGCIRLGGDRHSVVLPRLGRIHIIESTRKLARRIDDGRARITRATITRRGGRWYVVLLARIQRRARVHTQPGTTVGIDVGVKDMLVAATPDGQVVGRVRIPDTVKTLETRKTMLQRRLARKDGPRRGHAPSKRWLRAQAKVAKADARSTAIRQDALHKATTDLARRFETIVVEDLNIAGMMTRGGARKRGLNRGIARSAMGTIRRQMEYKTAREGGVLVLADRYFPSSKTCSGCGVVKTKLLLSERTYACVHCGMICDRDVNAAINLARLAHTQTEPRREWTGERTWSRAEDQTPLRESAAGHEASTPTRGPSAGNGALHSSTI